MEKLNNSSITEPCQETDREFLVLLIDGQCNINIDNKYSVVIIQRGRTLFSCIFKVGGVYFYIKIGVKALRNEGLA